MKLSAHFDSSEFKCSHCGDSKPSPVLVSSLEELRAKICEAMGADHPLIINSGYRCDGHTESIKRVNAGLSRSQHQLGLAADCVFPGVPIAMALGLAHTVFPFRNGGIGIYPTVRPQFLHLDARHGGNEKWGRVGGEYCSYHTALRVLIEGGQRHG